jgi:NAD(P)-dependent dehydrogenase (short-subunit alcohol dehydrogenase family)
MNPTASLFDLTGRSVLVTSSTKGIGRAVVEGCARWSNRGRQ